MPRFAASTPADLVAAVIGELEPRALACGAKLLVVGAAARDLMLSAPSGRATNDVDIAVAVESRDQVDALTAGLPGMPGHPQRYVIHDVLADVVPFGGIESADRTVTSADGFQLNVFGFREALDAAVSVPLPGGVVARVASLPAQAALKLIAYVERRHVVLTKDAVDLRSLLVEYAEPAHLDDLYDTHFARVERYGFDPYLAAADRIGAEAAALLGAGSGVLERRTAECVADDELPRRMGHDADRNRALLEAFLMGMREG